MERTTLAWRLRPRWLIQSWLDLPARSTRSLSLSLARAPSRTLALRITASKVGIVLRRSDSSGVIEAFRESCPIWVMSISALAP